MSLSLYLESLHVRSLGLQQSQGSTVNSDIASKLSDAVAIFRKCSSSDSTCFIFLNILEDLLKLKYFQCEETLRLLEPVVFILIQSPKSRMRFLRICYYSVFVGGNNLESKNKINSFLQFLLSCFVKSFDSHSGISFDSIIFDIFGFVIDEITLKGDGDEILMNMFSFPIPYDGSKMTTLSDLLDSSEAKIQATKLSLKFCYHSQKIFTASMRYFLQILLRRGIEEDCLVSLVHNSLWELLYLWPDSATIEINQVQFLNRLILFTLRDMSTSNFHPKDSQNGNQKIFINDENLEENEAYRNIGIARLLLYDRLKSFDSKIQLLLLLVEDYVDDLRPRGLVNCIHSFLKRYHNERCNHQVELENAVIHLMTNRYPRLLMMKDDEVDDSNSNKNFGIARPTENLSQGRRDFEMLLLKEVSCLMYMIDANRHQSLVNCIVLSINHDDYNVLEKTVSHEEIGTFLDVSHNNNYNNFQMV